ncbi:MAG: restriction endonuclease [Actinomycetota bacterium]|nr:restriction endonuclease [Actinomycetota bacterium]
MAGPRKQPDRILGGGAIGVVVLLSIVSHDSMGLVEGLKWLLGGLLLMGVVVAVALVPWYLWNRPSTPTAEELSLRFEAVRSMSGAQFEVFVADLFRAMGHRAVVLGGVGDQGVDVIVNRRGERVAVQCKNHKGPVGNRPVQEVFAGAQHHRCVEAWVVAPAGYTSGAIALARSTDVSLFDAHSVRKWIRKVGCLEKELAGDTESEIRDSPPERTPITKEITEARKRALWHPHPDDPPGG